MGGSISHNHVYDNDGFGGTVHVNGYFEMNGGAINNNYNNESGGGLYVDYTGTAFINNGIIINNKAGLDGGGIINYGNLTLKNAIIKDNTAKRGAGLSCGCFNFNPCVINVEAINGDSVIIEENTAEYRAGGVQFYDDVEVNIKGKLIVNNNMACTKGAENLSSLVPLNITGNILGSNIYYAMGVASSTNAGYSYKEGVITSNYLKNSGSKYLNTFLHYDGSNEYCSFINNDGEIEVKKIPTGNLAIKQKSSENGIFNINNQYAGENEEVEITVIPDEGYELDEILFFDENGNKIQLKITKKSNDVYSFVMPDQAVTIEASFKVKKEIKPITPTIKSYTVKFDMQGHGDAIHDKYVVSGYKIHSKPDTPKADGYVFGGWYKDSACTQEWDWDTDVVTGDTTLYAKWISTSVAKTSIKSLKVGKNSFTVKVKIIAGAEKYQVRYSLKKSMKSAVKKSFSVGKVTKTVKKLKAKKTYYVQVRTLKRIEGKTYCSSWSKAKKVKIK